MDLRSWRFWNKGIIDLAGDPMKCRERDSTLVTKDRTLIKAFVWSTELLSAKDGFEQRDKDRI
jgi:hypothetical protein